MVDGFSLNPSTHLSFFKKIVNGFALNVIADHFKESCMFRLSVLFQDRKLSAKQKTTQLSVKNSWFTVEKNGNSIFRLLSIAFFTKYSMKSALFDREYFVHNSHGVYSRLSLATKMLFSDYFIAMVRYNASVRSFGVLEILNETNAMHLLWNQNDNSAWQCNFECCWKFIGWQFVSAYFPENSTSLKISFCEWLGTR